MKYVKMLGLAAVAAVALMAFAGAGSASATVLCETTPTESGTTCHKDYGAGLEISASLEGSSILKSGTTTLNTCTGGKFAGTTSNTGGASETVTGTLTTIDFENCASTVHTEKLGTLEIHHIPGTENGTVTASGTVIGNTIFGTNCLYESGTGLHLGTLTGGHNATLHVSATVKEAEPKKFICPDTPTWEATFRVTSPTNLYVAAHTL